MSYPPCLTTSAPTDSRLSVRSVAAEQPVCESEHTAAAEERWRAALRGDFLDCTVKVPSLLSLRIGIDPEHYSRTTTHHPFGKFLVYLFQTLPCLPPGLWLNIFLSFFPGSVDGCFFTGCSCIQKQVSWTFIVQGANFPKFRWELETISSLQYILKYFLGSTVQETSCILKLVFGSPHSGGHRVERPSGISRGLF